MESSHRYLALLLVLTAIGLGTACSDGDGAMLTSNQGNVRVLLTSEGGTTAAAAIESASRVATGVDTGAGPAAPDHHFGDDEGDDVLHQLAQANITVSSLLARSLDGQLIDLAVDLPRTVDLLGLMDGGQVELPWGSLPLGTYDQIVVVITQVEFVFEAGDTVTLDPPGGGWTRVMPVTPFEVVEGAITTIELNFRPQQAFREIGGAFHFSPDFDCQSHP